MLDKVDKVEEMVNLMRQRRMKGANVHRIICNFPYEQLFAIDQINSNRF
jgi:hypothetical protein